MTREEWAKLLLSEEDKLQEEVVFYDADTVQYIMPDRIDTKELQISSNGEIKDLTYKRKEYVVDEGATGCKFSVLW